MSGLEGRGANKQPDVEPLPGDHAAVLQTSKRYIGSLTETELDRKLDHPKFPTVGVRLTAVISDNLQHAGQVAYIRGLLKGKGWQDI